MNDHDSADTALTDVELPTGFVHGQVPLRMSFVAALAGHDGLIERCLEALSSRTGSIDAQGQQRPLKSISEPEFTPSCKPSWTGSSASWRASASSR